MANIKEALNWRYAIKKFDLNKKLDEHTLNTLLDSLRMSPSSYGIQPWQFILVNNKEAREKIKEIGYNQAQITEASHLIVLCNKTKIDKNLVDEYIKSISETRNINLESLSEYAKSMKESFNYKSENELKEWAARQLYISLGVLLTSCALLKIDSCPMEGFDSEKLNKTLGLDILGLESRVLVALGYRSEEDEYSKEKKVRFSIEDVLVKFD